MTCDRVLVPSAARRPASNSTASSVRPVFPAPIHHQVRLSGTEKHLLITGDALAVLRTLPSESVQCCVTSPPYWGLRDYGTASWEGGDPECNHISGMARNDTERETPGGRKGSFRGGARQFIDQCGKCCARRVDQQIGLEETPELYVARLIEIFREVRRVLRDDGTLWLNLGDSYSATTKGSGGHSRKQDSNAGSFHSSHKWAIPPGLKPKDLVGIPWRVAFALQADGWYLRSDIIWAKPNPMPESVTDRPTKAHEYLFRLAKSPKYYYDADAVKEVGAGRRTDTGKMTGLARLNTGGPWKNDPRPSAPKGSFNGKTGERAFRAVVEKRNRRTVWTVATAPFRGAHFATFPPKLIEPCILAGCPEGGTVLDPFAGACTTLLVAAAHSRHAIGIDLNPEYVAMSKRRLADAQTVRVAKVAAAA